MVGLPFEPDAPVTANWTLNNNVYGEIFEEPNNLIVESIRYQILELTEATLKYWFTVNYPDEGEIKEICSFEIEIQ